MITATLSAEAEPVTTSAPARIDLALAHVVAARLRSAGLSRTQLAQRTRKHPHWLNRRLAGKTTWKMTDLFVISLALGAMPSELLGDAEMQHR